MCCYIQADIDVLDIIGKATSELLAGLEDGHLLNVPDPALDQKLGNNRARISAADDCDARTGRGVCACSLGDDILIFNMAVFLPVRGWQSWAYFL